MEKKISLVAPHVVDHLKRLVKTAGLPDTEESLEQLAAAWLEKQECFFEQTKANGLEEVESFTALEAKGALVMTYSGSLLNIGPLTENGRLVEYASIGLRKDVPESASLEDSVLAKDIARDAVAEFSKGPIQKSSPIYAIACVAKTMAPEAEEEILGNVTMMLTKDFIEVNKTIIKG